MKKSLFSGLLVVGVVFLTACHLMGVSKPDTSYEGYLQVKKGMSLKDVETLLGAEDEILSAKELQETTNQTEERRIYQDQEETDITYEIEFDKKEKVVRAFLKTSHPKNTFLIKQSEAFSLETLESLVTLKFDGDDEFSYCFIKPENSKKRTELIKQLGNGIPNTGIHNSISYYLEEASYVLHFDEDDRLAEVDQHHH
ncbi:hypothetical protein [Isobaculum melis]|uniref:Uncharacterized protein n=1 Tax=Isobaculum melis TaxID=142588 RepID=A0A1H9UD07_9LACT|nr:hypothetical protein [Isobaculum melis]SES07229.1 hypothetical protein SAMN04488559_1279 [Isobaculum melis]